jgi:hypothetical protein
MKLHGDYRVHSKKGILYHCRCVKCGHKKILLLEDLNLNPLHCSQLPTKKVDKIDYSPPDSLEDEQYSIFQESVKEIQDMIEVGDNDSGLLRLQKSALKTLIDLLPYAERTYRNDPRQSNAYAINALVSQIREMSNDLRSDTTKSQMIQERLTLAIQPIFHGNVQTLIDTMYFLKRGLASHVKRTSLERVEELIDNATKDMGKSLQDTLNNIRSKIVEST